jgi:antitoxin YefM
METISYTAIRAQLAKKMLQVCENHTPLIITRSNAKPVVMMSLDDYAEIEETNYLLKSPANAARLSASVDEIELMIAQKKKEKNN